MESMIGTLAGTDQGKVQDPRPWRKCKCLSYVGGFSMGKHDKPSSGGSSGSGKSGGGGKFTPDHNRPSHEDIAKGDTESRHVGNPSRDRTTGGTDFPERSH